MGVHGTNSCKNNNYIYPIVYIIAAITLFIIGSLYEADILHKTQNTKDSVWWYGFIGIIIVILLLPVVNFLFKYTKPSEQTKTYFWYFSHILCYFVITLVSPGQWPFWLGIGILWELFECYLSCGFIKKGYPITCSGMYDITANIAGIAIAMWIRSETPDLILLNTA